MKSKFFRLAVLFCAALLIVSCLLVAPTPVWARQMDGGSGGGSLTSEGNGGTASADEGSFDAHIDRANIDLGNGMKSGAAEGAAVAGRKGVIPGAIGGGVAKVVEGCTTCHDGSRPDKPGTTSPVRLNKRIGSSGAGGTAE
jgi:hypothetical protein